jgi:hypothetical protein
MDTGHGRQQAAHLLTSQHRRQALGLLGTHGAQRRIDRLARHLCVEKQQGAQRLVLGRGGDLIVDGEIRQERFDLDSAKLMRVAKLVETDRAREPAHVGFLGAN